MKSRREEQEGRIGEEKEAEWKIGGKERSRRDKKKRKEGNVLERAKKT